MSVDKELWKKWKDALRRTRLHGIDSTQRGVTSFDMRNEEQWSLSIRHARLYTVGCDIVGYSRRSLEGQLYLTTSLFVSMEAARDALRHVAWIPTTEPLAVLPTGDGALLVTSDLQTAFAFTLALNLFIEDLNRGAQGGVEESVEISQPVRILPCEVRYVLSAGSLIEIEDITGRRNFIGDGLVRCARILAASKGAHFLIDEGVMAEFLRLGGINEAASLGPPLDWAQQFHCAHLQSRQVKSGTFSFYNVFGFYNSRRFFQWIAEEKDSEIVREMAATAREYSIGSHDVMSVG